VKWRAAKAISFEITKKCNLQCKHCYRTDFNGEDLSDEEWIRIFTKSREQGFIQACWVGGEPLLRKNLIEVGKKFFPINAIITNGTIPLPVWSDTLFGVSVDGTEEVYKKIRGAFLEDQYERVKKNIMDGVRAGNKVYVLMTIYRLNKDVIEKFVENWHKEGVTGVILDFYTPSLNELNDPLWLGFDERDRIIGKIFALRKKYGDFLPWNTPGVLNNMKSANCKANTDRCRAQAFIKDPNSLKLNFKGNRMYPCVMGAERLEDAKIDCERCGCIFAFHFDRQAIGTSLKTVFL
jgi:MoaA/NifB/PqqE/SkfB family radical SAM enzyme